MKSKSFFFGTLSLLTGAAFGQSWLGTTSNNWGTAGNWNPSGVPAAGSNIIIANTTGSSNVMVLDANREIGNFQFGDTGTRTAGFSVRSTSANTLTLAGGLTASGTFGGVGLTFNGNLALAANQTWDIGGQIGAHNTDRGVFVREIVEANGTTPAGDAAIGSFALNGNLTKTGTGQLVFAATNISGAGNFIVDAGALKLNAGASRLLTVGGPGNITLNNDAQLFLSRNSGTVSMTRAIVLNNTSGMVWGGGGTANDTTVAAPIAWGGSAHTLSLPVGNRYESSGAWTGAATVNRTSASVLTVSGDLSGYTGTLNLDGGTTNLATTGIFGGNLSVVSGTANVTRPIAGNVTLTGGTANLSGDVGGTLTLDPAGTMVGEIAVAGNLNLNGGTLTVNPVTAGALGTSANLNLAAVTNIALGAAPVNTNPFTVLTYGGSLTGGAANLSLVGGAANYRNPTFSDSVANIITLSVGSESRIWSSGADWDINTSPNWQGGDNRFFQLDSVTFDNTGTAGSIAIIGVLTPASVTVNSSNDFTLTAAAGNLIAGSTGITKSGSGTLTLGGANTYAGGVTINDGTLRITSNQALGANGQVITIAAGGTLDLNGSQNTSRDYEAVIAGSGVGGNGAIVNTGAGQNAGFRSITLTDDATIGGAGRFDLRPITAGGGVLNLAGNILTKTGSNTFAIVDSVFTSDGSINVQSGELRYTRNSTTGTTGSIALASATILTFENNSSGTFGWDISMDNATLQTLGGSAFTADSAVSLTNTGTFNITPNFTINKAITGTGELVKGGAGALILAGDASHSGGTTVLAGTLQIGVGGTSGTIAGDINNSGNVAFDRSDAHSYSGVISGTGTLTKQGGGTLTLGTGQSYTGNTNINGGSLQLSTAANRLPTATNLVFADTAGANLDLNGLNQEVRALSGGGITGGNIINTGGAPATLTVRPSGTDGFTFSGQIDGDIRLELLGDKTAPSFTVPRQRLAGINNSFTGGVLVDGATLMVRQDGSLGAVPAAFDAAAITLRNNGTLLNEADGNELTIHANRGITVGAGGGALVAGFNSNVTVHSVISGAVGNNLTILPNNRTVVLTGNNTYAGDTILAAGALSRLSIGDGGTSGSLGSGNVTNDGQLTFNRSDAHSYAGDISGTGTVNQDGGGTLTLSGVSTYTGATTVSAGTLLVNGALGNTAVSIANAARLGGNNGSIAGSITTAAGSIIAPGSSPGISPGTLTVGSVDLTAGGTFEFDLGTSSDLLALAGALTGGGTLTFNFSDAGGIAEAAPYTLFTFGSQIGLDYPALVANTLPGGLALDPTFGTGGWLINSGNLQVQFIPEPSTALLAACGLLLAGRRRRA